MKTGTILDIFGAIIMLAAIALVVRNPGIVNAVGSNFTSALKVAKS